MRILADKELAVNGNIRADAAIELTMEKQKTRFWAEVKNEIRETDTAHFANTTAKRSAGVVAGLPVYSKTHQREFEKPRNQLPRNSR